MPGKESGEALFVWQFEVEDVDRPTRRQHLRCVAEHSVDLPIVQVVHEAVEKNEIVGCAQARKLARSITETNLSPKRRRAEWMYASSMSTPTYWTSRK